METWEIFIFFFSSSSLLVRSARCSNYVNNSIFRRVSATENWSKMERLDLAIHVTLSFWREKRGNSVSDHFQTLTVLLGQWALLEICDCIAELFNLVFKAVDQSSDIGRVTCRWWAQFRLLPPRRQARLRDLPFHLLLLNGSAESAHNFC